MPPRGTPPMVVAARLLPWRVSVLTAAPGFGDRLGDLLAWCYRLPAAEWFWPLPGGRTTSSATDFALWGFARQETAEAFAAMARALLGEAGGVTVSSAKP